MTDAVDTSTGEVGNYERQLARLSEARAMLAEARTVGDVLMVLSIADAARTYARARDLGTDARNYAADIVFRAQRRLGELIKADPEIGPGKAPSLGALGINMNQSSRAQAMAAIPAKVFDGHIARVIDAGEELTAAGLIRAVNGQTMVGSETNEWYTPAVYLDAARGVLGGIDLDPASCPDGNEVVRAARFYTIDDDGLAQPWKGRVWLNPPYGRLAGDFIARLVEEYTAGDVSGAVCLVNAHCTDTRWFQSLWDHVLCFTDHRIDFAAGTAARSGSTHGSVFAYLGPDRGTFAAEFTRFGAVMSRFTP